ncbi:SAM-dependent methyltransferase [Taibaiella sp. KBW10]|uniref:class I SAM-dependent methyltransferase n=1 Tax=Taibaiella sp. KBW10 TaxID=2153357 RepID=UPI000F59A7D6|nr:SAM-dependent methyltransferase [Taibaiella sp. KBW10]RQO30926.1 SAM-dependent methyltransferase [Taibaiella sp. KBW10]
MDAAFNEFFSALDESIANNTFVKVSLGNYRGAEALKNIYIKIAVIKKKTMLSFTYRYKTRDIVKNYTLEEAKVLLSDYVDLQQFRVASLFTLEFDAVIEYGKNNALTYNKRKPSHNTLPEPTHDKAKQRKLESEGKSYLQELKITDAGGTVYKSAQDKFKQINHYIEILSTLLKELPSREVLNIVDMGAGKGYLTFALYDYLTNTLQKRTEVIGVEYRKDLVDLCNDIAQKVQFEGLSFVEGSIENYESDQINVLIALHACDTATDDAIAKGIRGNADLIVVAPCCHKQIRREIEKNKAVNDLDFLLKHGIFTERQSEMVTDGLRAMIMEYYGYSTKVFEFISDAHTPKNVLIVGTKKQQINPAQQEIISTKIKNAKAYFGIQEHHLEKIMGL